MKKLIVTTLLLTITCLAFAQESHYHKGLRSQADNDQYGGVAAEPHFDGGGYYWSRARNVDDAAITKETREDSLFRVKEFQRLCRLAYDAYEAGDAMKTVVYGDSALQKRYHTADLYFFMGVSFEKIGNDDDADWAYRKAMGAGYPGSVNVYNAFKERQKERKAEAKRLEKEAKRKAKEEKRKKKDKQLAFPGAEGFGRYTTGGRGGKVYHVTTLEDGDQPGTLRWANHQEGPKTIIFDVSGTIFLKAPLRFTPNTTIAGQSAPGDGICLADYPVLVGSNNIIRYLRFRLGNRQVAYHEGDGLGSGKGHDIIVDHCSISWSIDECLSVYGCHDFTVQWCIVSQSLNNAGHKKGAHGYGGNWGGSGASYHHNLMAHHTSRTPRLGPSPQTQTDERMDFRNNVIYNWTANGCYGGEGMTVNIVNNYYKPGPGTPTDIRGMRITAPNIRTSQYTHHDSPRPNVWDKMWHVWGKYYVNGNVNTRYPEVTKDNWTYGIYQQIDSTGNDGTYTAVTKDTIRLKNPMPYEEVTTHTAQEAYELVLSHAGASLHRDAIDRIIIDDVRNGKATYTGTDCPPGIINSQDDISSNNAWPTLKSEKPLKDTDGDGIPDDWELRHGMNPHDTADGNTIQSDGYTRLEHYLNELVSIN
ncbi:MAG: pectate lyase [Prevotella sp.]|nr:pectate lyase [Prevotella sp.]